MLELREKLLLQDRPRYSLAHSARLVRVPIGVLRSWVLGGNAMHPLIRVANVAPVLLSFGNLVEAHVLRALRVQGAAGVKAMLNAVLHTERQLGTWRVLMRPCLAGRAGDVLLDFYRRVRGLPLSETLELRVGLEQHLGRVRWDDLDLPCRLYPFASTAADQQRGICIDPELGAGWPVISGSEVCTAIVKRYYDAGDSAEVLAEYFGLSTAKIEAAVLFEAGVHTTEPQRRPRTEALELSLPPRPHVGRSLTDESADTHDLRPLAAVAAPASPRRAIRDRVVQRLRNRLPN